MRILYITGYYKPAYVYGGPVRSTAALFEGLAKRGIEVTVLTTDANGRDRLDVPLLTPVNVDGVEVIYCPTKPIPGSAFYSPSQIREAKKRIPGTDLVNLQTFWGYATHSLSQHCIQHKMPYFVSLRGQLMDYAMNQVGWMKRLKKRLFLHSIGYRYLNGAAALHATSSIEIDHLCAYPIDTPAFVVPNSVDVDTFKRLPVRGQIRAQYKIPADALIMVMIGRIHAIKNPQIAVASLIATQKLCIDVHLIIVGPDEHNLKLSLIDQASQAGCAAKLHFTGLVQKDTLMQVMAESDLLIMPSESENFGMSAAEGMAAGLPILVSNKVPIGELAKEASAGEIAACNEIAFSKAAVAMLNNPSKLKKMGENGKIAANRLFHPDKVVKEMYEQLRQIVANKHNV